MASGCFPIVGDLPAIREWITDRENGLLCNPTDPEDIADKILWAARHPEVRQSAALANAAKVRSRAERQLVTQETLDFYRSVLLRAPHLCPT
jgi:glycosyltransferase involved in cell wall biosynthesis